MDIILRRAVLRIRGHMGAMGAPLDELTDEEIVDGVRNACQLFSNLGVTMDEAADAVVKFARFEEANGRRQD